MKLERFTFNKQSVFCLFIWLFICFHSMLLFRQTNVRNASILMSIAGIILFVGIIKFSCQEKKILLMYAMLLFTTILGALSQTDTYGIIQLFKVSLGILLLAIVLGTAKRSKEMLANYMNIYLFISVLISVQSLILFVLVRYDLVEINRVYYETQGGYKISFGILGFGDAINYFGSAKFLRTASFFKEPSKLGAFLIPPIFWSFAQYSKTKRKRYIMYGILMFLNFLATFSRACFLALAISCVCLCLFRTAFDKKKYSISMYKKICATILVFCCVIGFLLLGTFLYRFSQTVEEMQSNASSYENNMIMGMINRSTTLKSNVGNVFIRDDSSLNIVFEKIAENPLGYGLGWTGRALGFNNPTGLGFWVYSGGWVALLCLIIIYARLFYRYCLACMYSGDPSMKALGMSFIAVTVQNMSYGTWCEPYYMLIIALMIISVEAKEQEIEGDALLCSTKVVIATHSHMLEC